MQQLKLSESAAARRRFYLHLVSGSDGITPVTTEAGGQPQFSKVGGAFTNTSATLTAIGNGGYYVEFTAGELDTLGMIMVRYKSGATAEFQDVAQVCAYDPFAAAGLGLTNLDAAVSTLATAASLATVQADTDDIQTRLPATLVSGRMDSSVGAMASNVLTAAAINANAITAAKIATDAIGAAQLATDAVNEIQSGLATSSALATVQSDTDDIQSRLPASLVSGRMDSSVGAMATDSVSAAAVSAAAVTKIQSGLATSSALATLSSTVSSGFASVLSDTATIISALSSIATSLAGVAAAAATAVWAAVISTGFTAARYLRIIGAAVAGKPSGDGSAAAFRVRDLADTQDQVTGTADSTGQRTITSYGS